MCNIKVSCALPHDDIEIEGKRVPVTLLEVDTPYVLFPVLVVPREQEEQWLKGEIPPDKITGVSESRRYSHCTVPVHEVGPGKEYPTEDVLALACCRQVVEKGFHHYPAGLDSLRSVLIIRVTSVPGSAVVVALPYGSPAAYLQLMTPLAQLQA